MKDFILKGIKDKRRIGYSLFTGIVFGLFLVLGYTLKKYDRLDFTDARLYISLVLLSAAVFVLSFIFLGFTGFKFKSGKVLLPKTRRITVLICAIFIYVVWLVQLIGVFPGFFNYDAAQQWQIYAESVVTAHHPVIHTYIVGWLIHLSFNVWKNALVGCFIYCLIQMLITAWAYSSIISFLLKRGFGRVFAALACLWFALFPTCVMCVLSVTKDSLFTPFLIFFILGTIEFLSLKKGESLKWYKALGWYVSAFFTAVLRNNALYIVVPFIIYLIVRCRQYKQIWGMLGVLAALVIYLGPVTKAVTVEGVKEREYLSVPVQQVMRVYHQHKDELSEEDIELIENTFESGALLAYIPKIADVAKGSIRQEFLDENRSEIASLWLKLLKKYPAEYIESFLIGNSGFWYPWSTLVLNANGGEGYYVCRSYLPVYERPQISVISAYFKHFENASIVCNNPLTMWIFAPATYFYIFFLSLIYMLYRKRIEGEIFVMVFLIWLTFLLGPVALVRYVGFLYALVPLEIGLIIKK